MSIQTITFTTQLKHRDPQADYEIKIKYDHYYGTSFGYNSEDPGEINLISGTTQDGDKLTLTELEEIRGKAEELIVNELKADREESRYDSWRERNL